MKYEDELGFRLIIPRGKNESIIEHIKTSRACIFEFLRLQEKYLENNTCKNPLVLHDGGVSK